MAVVVVRRWLPSVVVLILVWALWFAADRAETARPVPVPAVTVSPAESWNPAVAGSTAADSLGHGTG
jgi:hypothetical protein